MAKNNKKKKKKNSKHKKKNSISYKLFSLILLSIILVVLIILVGYKVCTKYIFNNKDDNGVKVPEKQVIELDNYDYYLHGNATSYECVLADDLKKVLSNEVVDEEEYAKIVAKMFISDLFTLSNKNSSSDITSSQYVYEEYQDTYITMIKDTLYSNIEVNLDGKRSQSLPAVKNVEITAINNDKFSYNGEVLDSNAYYISANIEYEVDLEYPTTYNVVLVKNDDLLQVVKSSE